MDTRHPTTALCAQGADRKQQRLSEEEIQEGAAAFRSYEKPLEIATSSKYLRNLLTTINYHWPAVIFNLKKFQKSWYQFFRILGREGADPKMSGRLYMAVVQAILIFGSETWVETLRMVRLLGIFHQRVRRRLSGMQPWRWTYGS